MSGPPATAKQKQFIVEEKIAVLQAVDSGRKKCDAMKDFRISLLAVASFLNDHGKLEKSTRTWGHQHRKESNVPISTTLTRQSPKGFLWQNLKISQCQDMCCVPNQEALPLHIISTESSKPHRASFMPSILDDVVCKNATEVNSDGHRARMARERNGGAILIWCRRLQCRRNRICLQLVTRAYTDREGWQVQRQQKAQGKGYNLIVMQCDQGDKAVVPHYRKVTNAACFQKPAQPSGGVLLECKGMNDSGHFLGMVSPSGQKNERWKEEHCTRHWQLLSTLKSIRRWATWKLCCSHQLHNTSSTSSSRNHSFSQVSLQEAHVQVNPHQHKSESFKANKNWHSSHHWDVHGNVVECAARDDSELLAKAQVHSGRACKGKLQRPHPLWHWISKEGVEGVGRKFRYSPSSHPHRLHVCRWWHCCVTHTHKCRHLCRSANGKTN